MSTYRILVVDDDPDDREIMNEAFQIQGSTERLILPSAAEVLPYLQSVERNEGPPRLIITTLTCPELQVLNCFRR